MDPITNPYRPGAGRRPPVLAGRSELLATFDVVRRRVETYGEGDRSWILHGLRGVGKTVLLNELQAQVSDKGWILAKVEVRASTSLGTALAQSLHRSMRTATGRHPEAKLRRLLSVFKSFSLTADPSGTVSLGVKVDAARGIGDSGNFAEDLTALFDTMGQTARELASAFSSYSTNCRKLPEPTSQD